MVSMVIWPIIAALFQASVFINIPDVFYQSVNSAQELFLQHYYIPKKNELSRFNNKELRSWASNDYKELNAILRQEGFSIQLAPFLPSEFGVVSILDILVEWISEGRKTKIIDPDTHDAYPAVELEDNFKVYQSSIHEHPIVCIMTKSGDTVWMTIADQKRVDFELLEHIGNFKKNLSLDQTEYEAVTFPMIDFDEESELRWLIGLRLIDTRRLDLDFTIAQALQQTKLKMNEKGAHVKSAVAIGMMCTAAMCAEDIIIDKPFYLWIERRGVSVPIFAGYLDQTYWKDPKTLEL